MFFLHFSFSKRFLIPKRLFANCPEKTKRFKFDESFEVRIGRQIEKFSLGKSAKSPLNIIHFLLINFFSLLAFNRIFFCIKTKNSHKNLSLIMQN